jgi:hypothetical protein
MCGQFIMDHRKGYIDVGDNFEMLVTDLIQKENHQHNEKSRHHNDSAWQNLPPTSEISRHRKVTNI